jgi:hypothetical protein
MESMKRVKTFGLCLLAMFAVGAITAASALAGENPAVYRTCEKAPKFDGHNTGSYTESGCVTESPTHEGGYEMKPWALTEGKEAVALKGKGSKSVFYAHTQVVEEGQPPEPRDEIVWKVECAKSKSVGEITSPHDGWMQVTYKKCTATPAGGTQVKCTSSAGKGVIETGRIPTALGSFESGSEQVEGEYPGHAELAFGSKSAPTVVASFQCGASTFELTPGLGIPEIAEPSLNTCSKTMRLSFKVRATGEAVPWGTGLVEYGGSLEPGLAIDGTGFLAGLEATETLKSKTSVCTSIKEPET